VAIRRADIVVVRSVGVVRCVGVRYEDEESELVTKRDNLRQFCLLKRSLFVSIKANI
jgi:hypothetical protein